MPETPTRLSATSDDTSMRASGSQSGRSLSGSFAHSEMTDAATWTPPPTCMLLASIRTRGLGCMSGSRLGLSISVGMLTVAAAQRGKDHGERQGHQA